MKKSILSILAVMTAFVMACTPEDNALTSVSFVSPVATWEDGIVNLQITYTDYEGAAIEIPVVFGGTAEKDVDYTVSAENFVIGGDSPVTNIVITPTEIGAEKSITATLTAVEGVTIGSVPMCQVDMAGFVGYVSFGSRTATLKGEVSVSIAMYDGQGNLMNVESPQTIEFDVDTEKSTAVAGEHYEIVDNAASVTIDATKNEASFTLKYLKYEAGHDVLVLNIKETSRIAIGNYGSVTVYILGPDWDGISGTWTINEIVTTPEVLNETWFDMVTYEGFPELVPGDAVTIDSAAGKFTPSFTSAFKDYFIGESNMTNEGGYLLITGMYGEGEQLQLVKLDNINRYFSATETSEDKEALLGLQIIKAEDGSNLLDMYIIDYESHSFMPEFIDYEMYAAEKPVATYTGVYLNITFKKAE